MWWNPSTPAPTRPRPCSSAAPWLMLVAAAAAAVFMLSCAEEVDAFPFKRRLSCPATRRAPCNQETCPRSTGPSPEYKEEMQVAPQPWFINEPTGNTSSQLPDIVLEPEPGTGSRLGIGGNLPNKITHTLDPATLTALKEAIKGALPSTPSVPITLPMEPATSERLSRISLALEILAWLAAATFGGSAVGKFMPLVARVANGLLSASAAASQAVIQTPAATSSTPTSSLSAGSPAAPSSTPTPGT